MEQTTSGTSQRGVVTYDYLDEGGQLLFQVVRFEPKRFAQRRPDARGGWRWGLNGVRRVPYKLQDLLASLEDRVFVVEGEKDADALSRLGLVATTNAGGAGKWPQEFAPYFEDLHVAILPDNDGAGLCHAEDVARSLHPVAASVKVVWLPNLPERGDVSDWLAAGRTREELEQIVEETPFWEPSAESESMPSVSVEREPEHLTDLGNARRLVVRHGKDLRFCSQLGWLAWDGTRWARDENGEVFRRAKDTVRSIYAEAGEAPTETQRKALATWAKQSESEARIKAMVALAQSEPKIPVDIRELDADAWVLNCANGVVDLRTGDLRPHQREDLCTKKVAVNYDPTSGCQRFCDFLLEIMGGNIWLVEYLHRAFGYALTGITREQVLHLFYGTGANGKTTLLEVIRTMFGDYGRHADFSTFLAKKHDSIRNDVARLAGARLVTAVEVEGGQRLAEVLIKCLTGEDTVSARYLYREYFEFRPQFKLFLAANHKPIIRGTDNAVWRRVRLVPFNVTIPTEKQDRELKDKLLEELPGILVWLVHGCLAWQRDGLTLPKEVVAATGEYRREMDILDGFLSERCILESDAKVTAQDLYAAYLRWCEDNNEGPVSQRTFGMRLGERGLAPHRGVGGSRTWCGIRLHKSDTSDASF